MIEVKQAYKTFNRGTPDENPSIRGLSLKINDGDFVTVIGSNGAGKSTLMNLLSGSIQADSGSIHIAGQDVSTMPEYKRARFIGRVFQDPKVGSASDLSVAENLSLAMKRCGGRGLRLANRKAYHETFKEKLSHLDLGLEERLNDSIGLLSGGQRQAITLLMASMIEPHILLLDEHTAALDPKTADRVMRLTDQIIKEHKLTALMITHNMEQAVKYGNRLVMLHQGKVALDISGSERENLKEEDLLAQFSKLAKT
ncbi:MAG: ABC transporter ATP-binding protein [Oligoflexales bacterium]|nr:ABC transporter ATP-binding protein [Oligoflexales bacterium]